MDFEAFLDEIRTSAGYRDQIVYTRTVEPRPARYAEPSEPLSAEARAALAARGIERLYCHQAQALDAVRLGQDVLVATGAASGKSLCYVLPIVELLSRDARARALLLFPAQDQFRGFGESLEAAGLADRLAGVYDGDTPGPLRRRLRDRGRVVFSNPDMVHAALMPQHARWAEFLSNLRLLVLDEVGKEKPSAHTREVYFYIIDERLKWGLPVLVTSNLPLEGEGSLEELMGAAAVSRLIGMCQGNCFELRGEDFRRRKKRP